MMVRSPRTLQVAKLTITSIEQQSRSPYTPSETRCAWQINSFAGFHGAALAFQGLLLLPRGCSSLKPRIAPGEPLEKLVVSGRFDT